MAARGQKFGAWLRLAADQPGVRLARQAFDLRICVFPRQSLLRFPLIHIVHMHLLSSHLAVAVSHLCGSKDVLLRVCPR